MTQFDHLAFGLASARPALDQLVTELGATILYGKQGQGFRWVLLRVGDAYKGLNLELLEPWQSQNDPFLDRFLNRHGPGLHHLTFTTDNLAALLQLLHDGGYDPVDVDLDDSDWKEAFLSPRQVGGTIVQLVQSPRPRPSMQELLNLATTDPAAAQVYAGGGGASQMRWWDNPPSRAESQEATVIDRIIVGVPSLLAARRLYSGVLGGEVTATHSSHLELCWPTTGISLTLTETEHLSELGVRGMEGKSTPSQAQENLTLSGVPIRLKSA